MPGWDGIDSEYRLPTPHRADAPPAQTRRLRLADNSIA